jgi:hypothetical protein
MGAGDISWDPRGKVHQRGRDTHVRQTGREGRTQGKLVVPSDKDGEISYEYLMAPGVAGFMEIIVGNRSGPFCPRY